jgi:hypothetical protein
MKMVKLKAQHPADHLFQFVVNILLQKVMRNGEKNILKLPQEKERCA